MADRIIHRGPDDAHYYVDDDISLGFRRLSIIDLEGGRQPILNEDGSKALLFNGEIYNYQSLRAVSYTHLKVHDIGVACTLPVAEKGALHPLSSCQQPQLSSGCRRAAVIVRMQADNRAVTMTEMAAEIFNPVSYTHLDVYKRQVWKKLVLATLHSIGNITEAPFVSDVNRLQTHLPVFLTEF